MASNSKLYYPSSPQKLQPLPRPTVLYPSLLYSFLLSPHSDTRLQSNCPLPLYHPPEAANPVVGYYNLATSPGQIRFSLPWTTKRSASLATSRGGQLLRFCQPSTQVPRRVQRRRRAMEFPRWSMLCAHSPTSISQSALANTSLGSGFSSAQVSSYLTNGSCTPSSSVNTVQPVPINLN